MKRRLVYSRANLSYVLLILLFSFLASSCEKRDLSQGEKSIEGTWTVSEMNVAYGRATNLSSFIDTVLTFTDGLGSFDFTDEKVTWTFEPGDSISINDENWDLTTHKENSGFTRVRVFTLITDSFEFDCVFDNETKNSEKNAEKLRLEHQSASLGEFYQIFLHLDKE